MPSTAELAEFATDVSYGRLPEAVREATKRRVLDAVGVGVAAGSAGRPPTGGIRQAVAAGDAADGSRLWGSAAGAAPPEAAMYDASLIASGNGPSFLVPRPTPAGGSIAAVLAAAEARDATGEAVLAGLAVAHEIHAELTRNAPLEGLHPSTQGAIGGAAGAGRTIGLDAATLADAVGIAASRATLAVDEAGAAFEPLAAGWAARAAVYAPLLAEHGVEGPGSFAASGGRHGPLEGFDLDLDPGCERVRDAALCPYDAHPYAQSAVEAAIDLAGDLAVDPADVARVSVETFAGAVPHVDALAVAAALVDRGLAVRPDDRADLAPIADAVEVRATDDLTGRAEDGAIPARVVVTRRDGTSHERTREYFTGHPSRPASWGVVEDKFQAVLRDRYDDARRAEIVTTVRGLEAETAAELSRLLD